MEKIYNEDLKLISKEYSVKNLFNNEFERFIIEERIDPITNFKIRINKSIKNKPRSYRRIYSKKSKCPFCDPDNETPNFEFSKKMYIGDSVLFSNKYPYGKYHAVLVPNYKKHVKSYGKYHAVLVPNYKTCKELFSNKLFRSL